MTKEQAIKAAATLLRQTNALHVAYGFHDIGKPAVYFRKPRPMMDAKVDAFQTQHDVVFVLHRGNEAHESL